MNVLQAVVLGVVEGVTEFLPVSSTGHLLITERLLGLDVGSDALTGFTAVVQVGAILAAVAFFFRDIVSLVVAFVRGLVGHRDEEFRFAMAVLLGSIPIAVVGFLLKDVVKGLQALLVVGIGLIVWSPVMVFAERRASQARAERSLTYRDALVIGGAQCLALMPGVSRSGATISAGLLRGLDRVSATRLSFLLGIPALVGAGRLRAQGRDQGRCEHGGDRAGHRRGLRRRLRVDRLPAPLREHPPDQRLRAVPRGSGCRRDRGGRGGQGHVTAPALACRASTGTSCTAHTRAYRDGALVDEGFDVGHISDLLAEAGTVVWLDLLQPSSADLEVVTEELGLHPLAVEDAVHEHQRPKLDHYDDHLFLSSYVARLDPRTKELTATEVAVFITPRAMVTVRKGDELALEPLLARWDGSREQAGSGVAYLLHGLLDLLVDGHFEVVTALDDEIEGLEDVLFDPAPRSQELQRRSFEVRKSLVLLRRVVLPMREVVNALLRRDLGIVDDRMGPYFQDVYDHVLRAAEWTEGLRDLVGTILETNLTLQGNRLNEVMRKLTAWAAILAVTTAVTGFYGQNVPYPGFGKEWGFVLSLGLLLALTGGLYAGFRRRGWL